MSACVCVRRGDNTKYDTPRILTSHRTDGLEILINNFRSILLLLLITNSHCCHHHLYCCCSHAMRLFYLYMIMKFGWNISPLVRSTLISTSLIDIIDFESILWIAGFRDDWYWGNTQKFRLIFRTCLSDGWQHLIVARERESEINDKHRNQRYGGV